jgi:predicted oxidoreductase
LGILLACCCFAFSLICFFAALESVGVEVSGGVSAGGLAEILVRAGGGVWSSVAAGGVAAGGDFVSGEDCGVVGVVAGGFACGSAGGVCVELDGVWAYRAKENVSAAAKPRCVKERIVCLPGTASLWKDAALRILDDSMRLL